jgi:hypothetical protein
MPRCLRTLVPKPRAVAALLAALAAAAWAGENPAPAAPRDAAEKVQEGNVKNWIEYYQRTRGLPPVAETPPGASAAPQGAAPAAAATPPGAPAAGR